MFLGFRLPILLSASGLGALVLLHAAAPSTAQDRPIPEARVVAAGEHATATVPMAALLEAIAGWVAADVGLPHPDELPALAFVDESVMAAVRADQAAHSSVSGRENTIAFYNTRTGTIHLPADWTGASATELSILVHEMVHHLQAASDQRFPCPSAREKDALAAQERWLARFGETLEEAIGITPLTRLVVTNCMF